MAAGALALLLFYNLLWKKRNFNTKIKGRVLPEPSGALPILGHVLQLSRKVQFQRTMAAFADKYGPIFLIRMGMHPTLIVSNHEIAKECFTTNDQIFASRPLFNQGKYLGYNNASYGFASYGAYWRHMRKVARLEILSTQRVEALKHTVFALEINIMIEDLFLFCKNNGGNSKVDMTQCIEILPFNVMLKVMTGRRYSVSFHDAAEGEVKHLKDMTNEFMYLFGQVEASDLFPFLGWFNFQTKYLKSMKRLAKEMDELCESWIEEHTTMKEKGDQTFDQNNFIDILLSVIEEKNNYGYSRDTIIKASITSLVLGATDTTATTILWLLSLLLKNKHTLKLVQEELDLHVGRERKVEYSDINNLVYLQATVKETLRLYPPGPVLAPHLANEDCQVQGYHVPKGTRLIVNAWKMHRDPNVWPEPEEFKPERFLTTHKGVDASGKHFVLLPFGSGRRSCPGYTFATQLMYLTIAHLLQGFDFTMPSNEPIDMSETISISLSRETPLEVCLTPHLSPELYA
ncbi:putative Cytochrome P450 [Quillaja saponaria]|uniref:Cytochrome P450 n=1 Tax=Quillaja saponaria TaxID=32244 RepID=A0AAD7LRE0_QUISA|nr:putative Cytochrome P450 [Quillaja saponaria]